MTKRWPRWQSVCISSTKDDAVEAHLRGAVEAALNVGVHCAILEAGRTKVNNLDLARLPLEQNVLWLQVTMHNLSVA